MTTQILTLKPTVTQHEALRKFSAPTPSSVIRRLRSGPLRRIADAYVPFYFYRAQYELGRARQTRLFAIDAVDGSLDLFEFPSIPDNSQLISIRTRNHIEPVLTDTQARQLLSEKVLRVIFQQGFFKLRDSALTFTRESVDFHLPYWLAFYGNQIARCRVLDATRRRIEGAKASALFEHWLAA